MVWQAGSGTLVGNSVKTHYFLEHYHNFFISRIERSDGELLAHSVVVGGGEQALAKKIVNVETTTSLHSHCCSIKAKEDKNLNIVDTSDIAGGIGAAGWMADTGARAKTMQ